MRVILIMAGGTGERFWPLSRRLRPKQLLPLTSDLPMLGEAVQRGWKVPGVEHVYIVLGPHLVPAVQQALPGFPPDHLLVEPQGKNTAPCLAFAATVVAMRHGWDTSMAVFTADSLIRDVDAFARNADLAFEMAEQQDVLVTFGAKPREANTGFGYLEAGDAGAHDERGVARPVHAFREKPDFETAQNYVASGRHFWNTGMFVWKCSALKAAMQKTAPELAQGADRIAQAYGTERYLSQLEAVFAEWPKISIDYAVMEKAPNVYLVEADFDWDDVGTWNALARTRPVDPNGNLQLGRSVMLDTHNTVLYNADWLPGHPGAPVPLVATLGVENLIVAAAEGTVLICHRDRVQDIKEVLQQLRNENKTEYL
jgi:mannose-1-phosphate guanylyltransferase